MMRHLPLRNEAGQAAALVALLLFFVFLPLAALAIDGGIVYLVRRDLQNVADAAALAACVDLANGGDSGSALGAATGTVANNLGTYSDYVGSTPPTSNIGAGVSLIKGIEVSGVETRVALQRMAPTVLTQFVRRGQTPVTAQARCGANAGGGVLPVAVQRFDGRSPGATYVDHIAAEGAPLYTTEEPDEDFAYNDQYDYWVSVPLPLPGWVASPDNPGPQFSLVGQSSESNNTPSSMNGLVSLDIRNVAAGAGQLEFYNGVTSGQANTYKDCTSQYLCAHGYPGPFPQVGSQIAELMGVSASFGPGTIGDCQYKVGDDVVAIVYDGYVWTTPDFQVILTPGSDANGVRSGGYPNTLASAVQYSLTLDTAGPATWFNALSFDLTFVLSQPVPSDLHIFLDGNPVTPGTPIRIPNVFQSIGWSGTVAMYVDSAGPLITQTNSYLGGVSLVAESVGLGHTRGDSSQFGFMVSQDFAVGTDDARTFVNQGGAQNINLNTLGINENCNTVPVYADIIGGAWDDYFSSSQNATVKVKPTPQSVNFGLTANTTGRNDTPLTLRLTVGPNACTNARAHYVDVALAVLQPLPNQATINNFVIIQGFVVMRIDAITSNDVLAHVISPLYSDLSQITAGLRPRLVPWN